MSIFSFILPVLGLSLFEIISSIDNAIINAEVLTGMRREARRWFLFWGLLIGVFAVRGLLPLLIVWLVNPTLTPLGVLTATFSGDPEIAHSIENSAPLLLLGGGTFLLFLFFHWLFLEQKNYGLPGERFILRQGVWFYAVVSIMLAMIVWFAISINPFMAFSAVVGSTAFFITHGFKQQAEMAETKLLSGKEKLSDISKILYLEVLGSFAFTLSIPLILLGNGLGALVLRQLTISNIDRIKKYAYLKNGAMYSILFLGLIMVLDSFGAHIPSWFSPVITFAIVTYFFLKSRKAI